MKKIIKDNGFGIWVISILNQDYKQALNEGTFYNVVTKVRKE